MGMFEANLDAARNVNFFWRSPNNIPSDEAGYAAILNDGTSIYEFDLWWSGSLPSGKWLIEVVDGETSELLSQANYYLTQGVLPLIEASAETDLYTLHPSDYNPSVTFCHYLYSYQVGKTVLIRGTKLPPNKQITLGIYGGGGTLMMEEAIKTNREGEFLFEILPGLLTSEYGYFVYAIWDSHFKISRQGLVEFGGTDTCFILPPDYGG